jgi:hypothetical protein
VAWRGGTSLEIRRYNQRKPPTAFKDEHKEAWRRPVSCASMLEKRRNFKKANNFHIEKGNKQFIG